MLEYLMQHEEKQALVHSIFSTMAPYIDPLDTVFSLGMCHGWRQRVADSITPGARVLDICAGTGELAFRIARRVGKKGSVVASDFCREMLDRAREKMGNRASNVSFVISDAQSLVFPDRTFDFVTVSFGLRNVPDTPKALREVLRVLRPGGTFHCLELTRPRKAWMLPFYNLYTRKVMPFIARAVVNSDVPYTYLPESIAAFYPPAEFMRLMTECGFSDVLARPLSFGIATLYSGTCRK